MKCSNFSKEKVDLTSWFDAAKTGNVTQLNLLSHSIDINVQDLKGATALMFAVAGGHLESVKFLLGQGANKSVDIRGITALTIAAKNGNLVIFQLLLDSGTDLNRKTELGRTLLIIASYYGNLDIAKFLLKNKVNVNHRAYDGNTALMAAFSRNHITIAQLLLIHGANLEPIEFYIPFLDNIEYFIQDTFQSLRVALLLIRDKILDDYLCKNVDSIVIRYLISEKLSTTDFNLTKQLFKARFNDISKLKALKAPSSNSTV